MCVQPALFTCLANSIVHTLGLHSDVQNSSARRTVETPMFSPIRIDASSLLDTMILCIERTCLSFASVSDKSEESPNFLVFLCLTRVEFARVGTTAAIFTSSSMITPCSDLGSIAAAASRSERYGGVVIIIPLLAWVL